MATNEPPRPAAPAPQPQPFGPLWRIWLAVALLATAGLLIALWPALQAISGAVVTMIRDYQGVVGGFLLLAVACLIVAALRAAFAASWKVDASARQARVVRMQNELPIDIADVRTVFSSLAVSSLRDHYAVKQAEAERETPLLTSATFHNAVRIDGVPQLTAPETVTTIAPIPTFAQLLESGQIGPGRSLILGYNAVTGQPIIGAWKDLYSCGVGALQGAGKTWLLAFLLSQSAAAGGRLIICDLHAGDEESLANRIAALAPAFMCDIATTPKEITTAFAFADDWLEKRKTNGARWPIVLVADEWTSLLRTSAGTALPSHIQNIAEQGRKFNVNGMLAAQAWTKAASSDVRNQLTSHYVMRQRPEEARYQLGLRAEQLPDDIRSLPDATGYFLNVSGELTKIVVPHMTAADIARCGEMIDTPAASPPKFGFLAPTERLPLPSAVPSAEPSPDGTGTATGRQRDGKTELPSTATGRGKPISPEAARAASLYLAGSSIAEVVEQLRNVSSTSGGRAYRAAREEIEQLIREGIQQ